MCGRFVSRHQAAIERYFNVRPHQFQLFDRYNVAPQSFVPVIRDVEGERMLSLMYWSLIPQWSKTKKLPYKTSIARTERVAAAPSPTA